MANGVDPARNNPRRGRLAETLACRYLQARGLILVARNYRCRLGELDLIMRDGDCLVFVEVRLRRNTRYGGAAESIDRRKQRKLLCTARHYLAVERPTSAALRFDVVALEGDLGPRGNTPGKIQWIKNAFGLDL